MQIYLNSCVVDNAAAFVNPKPNTSGSGAEGTGAQFSFFESKPAGGRNEPGR